MSNNNTEWEWEISSRQKWFDIDWKGIFDNWELILGFVKRDILSTQHQTVLGWFWIILQPLLTTLVYLVIFGNIIKISTDGSPPLLFYLSGNMLWGYFSDCLFGGMFTFKTNAHIFGKIYFPRLLIPISNIITQTFRLSINIIFFVAILLYFHLDGQVASFAHDLWKIPFLLIGIAAYALGWGLIISVLTAKYKDLENLVHFILRLYMFASPIFYPSSIVADDFKLIYSLNPLAPLIESFRAVYNHQTVLWGLPLFWITTGSIVLVLSVGLILFSKRERKIMDFI